jgi:hypothetical protein
MNNLKGYSSLEDSYENSYLAEGTQEITNTNLSFGKVGHLSRSG